MKKSTFIICAIMIGFTTILCFIVINSNKHVNKDNGVIVTSVDSSEPNDNNQYINETDISEEQTETSNMTEDVTVESSDSNESISEDTYVDNESDTVELDMNDSVPDNNSNTEVSESEDNINSNGEYIDYRNTYDITPDSDLLISPIINGKYFTLFTDFKSQSNLSDEARKELYRTIEYLLFENDFASGNTFKVSYVSQDERTIVYSDNMLKCMFQFDFDGSNFKFNSGVLNVNSDNKIYLSSSKSNPYKVSEVVNDNESICEYTAEIETKDGSSYTLNNDEVYVVDNIIYDDKKSADNKYVRQVLYSFLNNKALSNLVEFKSSIDYNNYEEFDEWWINMLRNEGLKDGSSYYHYTSKESEAYDYYVTELPNGYIRVIRNATDLWSQEDE